MTPFIFLLPLLSFPLFSCFCTILSTIYTANRFLHTFRSMSSFLGTPGYTVSTITFLLYHKYTPHLSLNGLMAAVTMDSPTTPVYIL